MNVGDKVIRVDAVPDPIEEEKMNAALDNVRKFQENAMAVATTRHNFGCTVRGRTGTWLRKMRT